MDASDYSSSSGSSSSGRVAAAVAVVLDPMGYYEILGLTPAIEVRQLGARRGHTRIVAAMHCDVIMAPQCMAATVAG